jgi:hypothetical protein
VARLARCYLDLQEVRRIRRLPKAAVQAEKLTRYYAKVNPWRSWEGPSSSQASLLYWEVRKALVASGPGTGPPLRELFDAKRHRDRRLEIIDLWGEVRWPEAAGVLAELLRQHDRFWAREKLTKGWWQKSTESSGAERRREVAYETVHAVRALGRIGDSKAREAIRLTRQRWLSIEVPPQERGGPPSVVEECEEALRALDR